MRDSAATAAAAAATWMCFAVHSPLLADGRVTLLPEGTMN